MNPILYPILAINYIIAVISLLPVTIIFYIFYFLIKVFRKNTDIEDINNKWGIYEKLSLNHS